MSQAPPAAHSHNPGFLVDVGQAAAEDVVVFVRVSVEYSVLGKSVVESGGERPKEGGKAIA